MSQGAGCEQALSAQGEKMKAAKVPGVFSQACWPQNFPGTLNGGKTYVAMQVREDLESRGVSPTSLGPEESYSFWKTWPRFISPQQPSFLILPYRH